MGEATQLGFPRTNRFRMVRELGRGGLGVVFEAEDLARGQRVAVKVLHKGDSHSLYRIKREFRSLALLHHPSLVALYDLFADAKPAFFTMELVPGVDVIRYCAAPRGDGDASAETLPQGGPPMPSDETRLRAMLKQLAVGVHALHSAGMLHRDIKPSNLLVTPGGTLKILDFGLAVEVESMSRETGGVVGTAAYMAPEQAVGEAEVSPASDWYSVGVVLYELLTGRLPFTGPPLKLLVDKQQRAATPPRQWVADVPADLDELCEALLERNAAARPRPREILERLGVEVGETPAVNTITGVEAIPFAGRDSELDALRSAFDRAMTGGAHALLLRGPSGIGKSALVRELYRRLAGERPDLVFLGGRCYERETVAYRAMDGVIDELSSYWRQLPSVEAGALLPRHPGRLRQLFPVLGRVPAIARHLPPRTKEDPDVRRTRAYRALRETFLRLTDERPVIVFLDDLQWVDDDSVNLLADLVRPPDPPRMLLLLASRDYEREQTPALSDLMAQLGPIAERLELGPLPPAACRDLAERLAGPAAAVHAERIAGESEGNPFFLGELARHLHVAGDDEPGTVRLEDAIARRIDALPAPMQALLERICVAGEPIPGDVAAGAAGVASGELVHAVRALRAAHLCRASGGSKEDHLEPYHDRIREAVASRVSGAERRRVHQELAVALEAWGRASPEALARHWQGAGEDTRAAEHARVAGDAAAAATDFGRAAGWYHAALQLGEHSAGDRHQLRVAHADALASAGHPLEAAVCYRDALEGAATDEALELRRRAMEQLLGGGYVEPGLAAAEALLAEVGLSLPRSSTATIVRLVIGELGLRLRGLRYRVRREEDVPSRLRARADVAFTVGTGLSVIDTARAFTCVHHSVRASLATGDPERVVRTMAGMSCALSSRASSRQADRFLAAARIAAEQADSDTARGWLGAARAFRAYFTACDWPVSLTESTDALRRWRNDGRGRVWEIDAILLFRCYTRYYHGALRTLVDDVAEQIAAAARCGNRFLEVSLRGSFRIRHLIADQPDAGSADLDDALSAWVSDERGFLVQHWYVLWGQTEIALYTGDAQRAERGLAARERVISGSLLMHVVTTRCEYLHLQGRVALACATHAEDETSRLRLVARARKLARRLARQGIPMGGWFAGLLRAGAANLAGTPEKAATILRDVVARLDASETRLYAAAARRQLGHTVGGDEGDALLGEADAWMRGQGIVCPERMAAMLVPGWHHPDRA